MKIDKEGLVVFAAVWLGRADRLVSEITRGAFGGANYLLTEAREYARRAVDAAFRERVLPDGQD